MATEPPSTEDPLDEAEIHDVLRNDRRRLAIKSLQDADGGSLSLRDLAEQVAALETGESPPPRDKRQSVYVSLQQTHLPKLEGLGIVDYDTDEKSVSLRDRIHEVEVYMEVVPQYGLSWAEYYFTLGLLGLLTTVAVAVEAVLVGELPALFLAAFFFVVLMVSSAYNVYSQQDRVLFQRLRS